MNTKRIGTVLLIIVSIGVIIAYALYWRSPAPATENDMGSENISDDVRIYTDRSGAFTFVYPDELTVTGGESGYTNEWRANTASMGMLLASVSIPSSYMPNTNFSEATFKIGTSVDSNEIANCLADTSGAAVGTSTTRTINNTKFTVLRTADAGAGNFYETTSYRTLKNDQCYSVEYTIHSTNIGNYSPEQGITEFNKTALIEVLEDMVESFRFI